MAIKVNGTTVIDDGRNLVNIASGAGSSTAFGAVGTYCVCHNQSLSTAAKMYHPNRTVAGSNLQLRQIDSQTGKSTSFAANYSSGGSSASNDSYNTNLATGYINAGALTGTWRQMSPDGYPETGKRTAAALYVRIS